MTIQPLARITLSVDPARPEGIHIELDIGEPVADVTGTDVALVLAATVRHLADAMDSSWRAQLVERN